MMKRFIEGENRNQTPMKSDATTRDNFEAWFGAPLAKLMADQDSGFAVVMIVFPLLERYLRAVTKAEPNSTAFNRALLNVLPELTDEKGANMFWAIYRHGILHNVALSRETHGLSHAKPVVEVWPNGRVWMNPNLFAERVLAAIRADFTRFEIGVPLPQAQRVVEGIEGTPTYVSYLGTSMPPSGGKP
jgi:hypothetical protein